MWEISSKWVCSHEFSTDILVDENTYEGEQLIKNRQITGNANFTYDRINEHNSVTVFYDFENNQATYQSGNTNIIYDKHYYDGGGPGRWNNKNVIITKNNDVEFFSVQIIEEFLYHKEFWKRYSSGPRGSTSNGFLVVIASKCNPVK